MLLDGACTVVRSVGRLRPFSGEGSDPHRQVGRDVQVATSFGWWEPAERLHSLRKEYFIPEAPIIERLIAELTLRATQGEQAVIHADLTSRAKAHPSGMRRNEDDRRFDRLQIDAHHLLFGDVGTVDGNDPVRPRLGSSPRRVAL